MTNTDQTPSAMPQAVQSVVRTTLVAIGGVLVGDPHLQKTLGITLTTDGVQTVTGLAVIVANGAWGLWAWWEAHRRLADAIAAPAGKAKP